MITSRRVLAIALALCPFMALASDLAKEQRWAEQVVEALFDGEAVWLDDGTSEFLGIYTAAEADQGRAVIVMHGTGIHPDWRQVIQPLRVGLAGHHWNTLSIQMPVLSNEAEYLDYAPLYDEVAPRVDAAIRYLKDNGSDTIVLVGHSQGAAMAAYYLATAVRDVDGFVAIGMASYADDPRMDSIRALENIDVPVLDLYGDRDLAAVLDSTPARAESAKKAGNDSYQQVRLPGSNHFFEGREDELVESVAAWLDELAGG